MTVLIGIVLVLVIVGLMLWVIQQLPIDAGIARLIRVLVIVFVVIWLVYLLAGAFGSELSFGLPFRR